MLMFANSIILPSEIELPGEVVGHGGAPLVPHRHCHDASSHRHTQQLRARLEREEGARCDCVAGRSPNQHLSALSESGIDSTHARRFVSRKAGALAGLTGENRHCLMITKDPQT